MINPADILKRLDLENPQRQESRRREIARRAAKGGSQIEGRIHAMKVDLSHLRTPLSVKVK